MKVLLSILERGQKSGLFVIYQINHSLFLIHMHIMIMLWEMEEYKKAELAYKRALDIKADSYDALYNLSMVYNNIAAVLNTKMNDLPLSAQTEYEKAKAERDAILTGALPTLEKAYAVESDKSLKRVLNNAYQILGMNDKKIK